MKGSLLAFGCFAAGIWLGRADYAPAWMLGAAVPSVLLSLLILQVGLGLGSNDDLRCMLRSFRMRMLLLPFFTVGGTLLFCAFGSLLPGTRSLTECLAAGSGFGYYSLSSVMIAELYVPTLGARAAAELAAIALLANVAREMIALFCAPLFVRRYGELPAIAAAGITSMDVCLARIVDAGKGGGELVPLCIFHGIVLEISVPLLIQLFR